MAGPLCPRRTAQPRHPEAELGARVRQLPGDRGPPPSPRAGGEHFTHGVLRRDSADESGLVAAHLCNTGDIISLMTVITLRKIALIGLLFLDLLQHVVLSSDLSTCVHNLDQ